MPAQKERPVKTGRSFCAPLICPVAISAALPWRTKGQAAFGLRMEVGLAMEVP